MISLIAHDGAQYDFDDPDPQHRAKQAAIKADQLGKVKTAKTYTYAEAIDLLDYLDEIGSKCEIDEI